jgi:hypothetical protein
MTECNDTCEIKGGMRQTALSSLELTAGLPLKSDPARVILDLNASYTKQELAELTGKSDLKNCRINENFIGIEVTGSK